MKTQKKKFYLPKPIKKKKLLIDEEEENRYNEIFKEKKIEAQYTDDIYKKETKKLSTVHNSIDLKILPKRTIARIVAVQYYYANSFQKNLTLKEFKKNVFFLWETEYEKKILDDYSFRYASKIIKVLQEKKEQIIEKISSRLKENWSWDRIEIINQGIFLVILSCFQMKDINDAAILFNEAVLMCKWFSEKEDYKFVNGILNRIIDK